MRRSKLLLAGPRQAPVFRSDLTGAACHRIRATSSILTCHPGRQSAQWARMKLVAVSVVKNEADIIEPFIRHARAWVDHHLVFDHDSTDGTREILGALQREGLPLSVYTDDALGNLQQARSNHLAALAAAEFGADWVLPLDADEALAGPDRLALEKVLATLSTDRPASYRLWNYHPTAADDATQLNPFLRLQHCNHEKSQTKKVLISQRLLTDSSVVAGKGSHSLHRGQAALPDQPLPTEFYLAHFQSRSPAQQAMRVVLAELQKLSRGRAHAGLDLHYRLGFQLLAEDPKLFFETGLRPTEQLRKQPFAYRGAPLRYTTAGQDHLRAIRALAPFLEKLARSHGELFDQVGAPATGATALSPIRPLATTDLPTTSLAGSVEAFAGFTAVEGWENQEGPVPEAYLPVFHWGLAPATVLEVNSATQREARLIIEAVTYSERQQLSLHLNGALAYEHRFSHANQRERISCALPLHPGSNRVELRYTEHLQTSYDPRKLAVIFLSLRVV